jgi:hypothetical protein
MSYKIASALTAAALCLLPVAVQGAEKTTPQSLTAIENDPQFKEIGRASCRERVS